MIEVKNLCKSFGSFSAVSDISFKVARGEVFGLLGENGAGKTTTLRMLATMLRPTAGSAVLGGYDVVEEPERVRASIGILFGGETGLYDRLSAWENIAYFGKLNGMSAGEIAARIEYLAGIFAMTDYLHRRAGKFSKGMKQKTAFARSIVHDPAIMLLDEPTSGLDVQAMREVHSFISTCRSEGKTIVFSSHSMSEVERLCDRVAVIHKGSIVADGTLPQLREQHGQRSLEDIFVELTGVAK